MTLVYQTPGIIHCVKSVQIRSSSGPYYPFRIQENREKTEKTPSLDTFQALIELDFMPLTQNKDFAKLISKQGVQVMHH